VIRDGGILTAFDPPPEKSCAKSLKQCTALANISIAVDGDAQIFRPKRRSRIEPALRPPRLSVRIERVRMRVADHV